jgi:hypothetical protein
MGTYFDAYGNPIKPKSSGVVLPLLLALLASGGANYWLWKDRAKTADAAFAATGKLVAAEAIQKETAEKLQKMELEQAELIAAKDQALKDAAARALELAKLKDDVAGVEVTKEPEAAADDKDKAKADAKDKPASGKADAKTESKADAKKDKKADAKPKGKAKKKAAAEGGHKSKKSGGDTPAPGGEL